mgnify:CR=1 FL=1
MPVGIILRLCKVCANVKVSKYQLKKKVYFIRNFVCIFLAMCYNRVQEERKNGHSICSKLYFNEIKRKL